MCPGCCLPCMHLDAQLLMGSCQLPHITAPAVGIKLHVSSPALPAEAGRPAEGLSLAAA